MGGGRTGRGRRVTGVTCRQENPCQNNTEQPAGHISLRTHPSSRRPTGTNRRVRHLSDHVPGTGPYREVESHLEDRSSCDRVQEGGRLDSHPRGKCTPLSTQGFFDSPPAPGDRPPIVSALHLLRSKVGRLRPAPKPVAPRGSTPTGVFTPSGGSGLRVGCLSSHSGDRRRTDVRVRVEWGRGKDPVDQRGPWEDRTPL